MDFTLSSQTLLSLLLCFFVAGEAFFLPKDLFLPLGLSRQRRTATPAPGCKISVDLTRPDLDDIDARVQLDLLTRTDTPCDGSMMEGDVLPHPDAAPNNTLVHGSCTWTWKCLQNSNRIPSRIYHAQCHTAKKGLCSRRARCGAIGQAGQAGRCRQMFSDMPVLKRDLRGNGQRWLVKVEPVATACVCSRE